MRSQFDATTDLPMEKESSLRVEMKPGRSQSVSDRGGENKSLVHTGIRIPVF